MCVPPKLTAEPKTLRSVEMDVNESHNEYVERKRKRDEMRGGDDDDA